jgi:NAD(P)-dependent dehydrogenase (short-subunit alcohol dehydrogenase family)
MQGKVIVITGATSGIGHVAAKKLAEMGARIVFVARDRSRGEATLAQFRQLGRDQDHRVHYADLSRLAELKRVASDIAAAEPRIDVLMNNAGAMFHRKEITEDGLEMTFALNHMAYFVLTHFLRDRVLATPGSRIVNTSSNAHRAVHVNYQDLQQTGSYRMFRNYCLSKLYNLLFTRELSRQLQGTVAPGAPGAPGPPGVTANALHPGFVATRFGDATSGAGGVFFKFLKYFAIKPEEGAKTLVYLASSPDVANTSGQYFYKCAPTTPTKDALDDEAARWLWNESRRLASL